MHKKYSIRTVSELNEKMQSSEIAGKLITKEQARAILERAPYEVLKKYMNSILYEGAFSSPEEKREWLIKNILCVGAEGISLNAYLHAKYHKKVTATDATTAIEMLAKADTREEMKCILENLSVEELKKIEESSIAEVEKKIAKTNLINLIISYVEYFKSIEN